MFTPPPSTPRPPSQLFENPCIKLAKPRPCPTHIPPTHVYADGPLTLPAKVRFLPHRWFDPTLARLSVCQQGGWFSYILIVAHARKYLAAGIALKHTRSCTHTERERERAHRERERERERETPHDVSSCEKLTMASVEAIVHPLPHVLLLRTYRHGCPHEDVMLLA